MVSDSLVRDWYQIYVDFEALGNMYLSKNSQINIFAKAT
jgi:hypothetical protein